MRYFIIVLMCLSLTSCATIASRYERNENGYLVEVERLKIQGLGNKKAKFDKHTIENDTGLRIPDVNIDDFKTD